MTSETHADVPRYYDLKGPRRIHVALKSQFILYSPPSCLRSWTQTRYNHNWQVATQLLYFLLLSTGQELFSSRIYFFWWIFGYDYVRKIKVSSGCWIIILTFQRCNLVCRPPTCVMVRWCHKFLRGPLKTWFPNLKVLIKFDLYYCFLISITITKWDYLEEDLLCMRGVRGFGNFSIEFGGSSCEFYKS